MAWATWVYNIAPFFSALQLGAPSRDARFRRSTGNPATGLNGPLRGSTTRGDLLVTSWYDGLWIPQIPPELDEDEELNHGDGIIFVTRGKCWSKAGATCNRASSRETVWTNLSATENLAHSIWLLQEWLAAPARWEVAQSNFDFAGPLTGPRCSTSARSASWADRKLLWDSEI